MQYKITQPSRLLNRKGELVQKGYATSLLLEYRRQDVKAKKIRLKEWDYYLIHNEDFGIALTIGKSASFGLFNATFIDFKNNKYKSKTIVSLIPKGKLDMPESSEFGDIIYKNNTVSIAFTHENCFRNIYFKIKNFEKGTDFEVSLVLFDEPEDSMVISTPFREDKKAFYYNQKVIGMKALGTVQYLNSTYSFDSDTSFALLDWGRGVWPYRTTWYWSAGQGYIDGKIFGFNLGYGFGDTSAATENMLFYDGKSYKLKQVQFIIPKNEKNEYDYTSPWIITSSDRRFEMVFLPVLDRNEIRSAGILSTEQHQIFGKFTGTAVIDRHTVIKVKDLLGFAERVENKW